jgi:hypothetical protein
MSFFGPKHGFSLWLWSFLAVVAFVALFAFLNTLPGRAKQRLIIIVTFLSGLYYFLEYMLWPGFLVAHPEAGSQDNVLSAAQEPLSNFLLVTGAMAIGLGVFNLLQINGRTLFRMRRGWHDSLIFFVGLIGMIWVGIAHGQYPSNVTWTNWYNFLFMGLYQSLASTTFALLAFFIASAAFRAFRIGSVEATLMMITAFIVMLGNVGSEVLTGRIIPPDSAVSFLRLDNITYWIMTTVNMSAQRALLFGIAMGELAIALRIWLSLERGHFFEQEV